MENYREYHSIVKTFLEEVDFGQFSDTSEEVSYTQAVGIENKMKQAFLKVLKEDFV